MNKPLYKNTKAKETLMQLYDQNLADIKVPTSSIYVETSAGKTHILTAGKEDLPPLVVLHGINAGAPVSLGAIENLSQHYRLYAIDTVGQTTRSAETRLGLKDDSFGKWVVEILDQLELEKPTIIGASYGGFILRKTIAYAPHRIQKAIFLVPAGFVNGPFWASMKLLTWPLIRYKFSGKEKHLRKFMSAFYTQISDRDVQFQKTMLGGVNLDFRRPPLITAQEVAAFEAPVYLIVADKDIFFPSEGIIKKAKAFFKNFKEHAYLRNNNHIPNPNDFPVLEDILLKWLKAD